MKTPDHLYLRGGLVLLAASGMMFKDEMVPRGSLPV
jgi:hypothetical protein